MNTKLVAGKLLDANGTVRDGESFVVREHSLSVFVGGNLAFQCVCTRTALRELITGRLFAEGIISSVSDIAEIHFNESENKADVFLKGGANRSAGSGKKRLPKPLPAAEVRREWIFALAEEFSKETKLHHATQGTHSCLLGRKGTVVYSCEDIGRHNAVDKAVGYALINGIPPGECILFSSGRVPTDMVEKAAACGIPVLMSKSVPTAESIAMADEYGLTLICRAWPDQCEIFTDHIGIIQ